MKVRLDRGRAAVALIGGVALLGCVALGFESAQQVLLAYLAVYMLFLAPALGSLPMLMLHALTGGRWGLDLRRGFLLGSSVLPLLAVLLVPILIGATLLYPWADVQRLHDAALAPQRWYLNLPFFWLRAVVCMGLWLGMARALRLRLEDPARAVPVAFAVIGLIVYAVTITVAAVDWVGSLVPQWHSSTFGLTIAIAQMLAATALAIILVDRTHAVALAPLRLRDLGTLLMTLVLGWGYLVFMDFLTAWIADLPAEIAWYLPRLDTGWRWLGVMLVVPGFVLPFAVLLSRQAKQNFRWLAGVASLLLFSQALFALWLVLPGKWTPDMALVWTLPLACIGIGGWCWLIFDFHLAKPVPAWQGADAAGISGT